MADVTSERHRKAIEAIRARRSVATPTGSEGAPMQAQDDATPTAPEQDVSSATHGATNVATRVAASGALQRATREATVRRAYTLYERQDDLLRDLAHELKTDKSDVLRQIVDAWLASQ